MQLFLLGGYSPHNKTWIREVEQVLEPLADKCIVHDYAHWDSGGKMDMEPELSEIAAKARGLQDYAVFAKSIGTVLTIEAVGRGLLAPKTCIFAGLPLEAIADRGNTFNKQLADLNCPVIFIQNRDDPVGSFEKMRAFVDKTHPASYTLIELPGSTHDYTDLGKLETIVKDALGKD